MMKESLPLAPAADANEQADWLRFLVAMARDDFPGWFRHRIVSAGLNVASWGSREESRALLKGLGLGRNVVDTLRTERGADERGAFDVVFSADAQAHQNAPNARFMELAQHARAYIVLLLPWGGPEDDVPEGTSFPDSIILGMAGWQLRHLQRVQRRSEHRTWNLLLALYATSRETASFPSEPTAVTLEQLVAEVRTLKAEIQAGTGDTLEGGQQSAVTQSSIARFLARLRAGWPRRPRIPNDPSASIPVAAQIAQAQDMADVKRTVAGGHALLQPATPGIRDVFVWSVINWHFRFQRPQHVATALTRAGHRVFYISSDFDSDPVPGFRVEALDESGRLFQVHLHLDKAPPIYYDPPCPAQVAQLRGGISALLEWTRTTTSLSWIQYPYWADFVAELPDVRLIYDCMDHFAGFEDGDPRVLAAEHWLWANSDAVVVTSEPLRLEVTPYAKHVALIRNAGEYAFFSVRPHDVFSDPGGRKVIGYFGAINEWFDIDLIRAVARAHPEALVLLIGGDAIDARSQLAEEPNVEFTGEMPYPRLPFYLYGFDVALLPFRIIPLTLATNPVKVYEYLASGVTVVSVRLPEMTQFDGLVEVADRCEDFVHRVTQALENPPTAAAKAARREFAAGQTWDMRATAVRDLIRRIEASTPDAGMDVEPA